MKRNFKWLIVGMVFSLIITSSVAVFAENRSIQAFFNNIKISINGTNIETDTEPFIYNGRTYVPVRFIAEALGKEVKFNETTNTVEITGKLEASNASINEAVRHAYILDEYKALGDLNDKLDKFYCQILTTYFEHYLYKDSFNFSTINYDLKNIKNIYASELTYIASLGSTGIDVSVMVDISFYHSQAIKLYENSIQNLQAFSKDNDFSKYQLFIDDFTNANENVKKAADLINFNYEETFKYFSK